jgi:hypothetical protein
MWPASGTSSTRSSARIAEARRTATASSTGRKCHSRGRGCGRKTSANNGWGVMSYSSAAGLLNKGMGQDDARSLDTELCGRGEGV